MRFKELLEQRARKTSCSLTKFRDHGRRSQNLFQLSSGDRSVILYFNESNSIPGFWGISPNQLQRISHGPFLVLFLRNSDDVAYIATPKDVSSRVGLLWRQAKDGDFKVHENARILGIARFGFADAVEFLCRLVESHPGESEAGYQALAKGDLQVEGIAEFLVRTPGARKQVARIGRSNARVIDLMAGLAAWIATVGDSPASIIAPLLPILATYTEILSDDEAMVVRVLAELTPSGPIVPESLILAEVNRHRSKRSLPTIDGDELGRALASLQQKGCIARTLTRPPKWRLREFVL